MTVQLRGEARGTAAALFADERKASVDDLISSSPTVSPHIFVDGFFAPADGGASLWHQSLELGVRGKPIVTDVGTGLPDGQYLVNLIGGGGTGATARVMIVDGEVNVYTPSWSSGPDDDFADAIICEPGSGYTSEPYLSDDPDDWFLWDTPTVNATFGAATFPQMTFRLHDGLVSVRTVNGKEYLMNHGGRIEGRTVGVMGRGDTLDVRYLQEAMRALVTGRGPIISQDGAGAAYEAGGKLVLPPGVIAGNDEVLWANATCTPTGGPLQGFSLDAHARGAARMNVFTPTHAGTILMNAKIVLGYVAGSGQLADTSRGVSVRNLQIIGGMEWYGVQQTPVFEDCLIIPDSPVGEVRSGMRSWGYGLYMHLCSTGGCNRVYVSTGHQQYGEKNNALGGICLDNCDQWNFEEAGSSGCLHGLVCINGCLSIHAHEMTMENSIFEDVILENAPNSSISITQESSTGTDISVPRVRIGDETDSTKISSSVRVFDSYLSGTGGMVEHAIYSKNVGAHTFTVNLDYTTRYQAGGSLILLDVDDNPVAVANIVSSSYDDPTGLTTVVLDGGLTSAVTQVVVVGDRQDRPLTRVDNSHFTTVDTAVYLAADSTWIIVRNPVAGDFPAKVTSKVVGSGTATIGINNPLLTTDCTGFMVTRAADAVAIDAQRGVGTIVDGNWVSGCETALRMRANADNVSYRPGRFVQDSVVAEHSQEIIKDAGATWAPYYGDFVIDGDGDFGGDLSATNLDVVDSLTTKLFSYGKDVLPTAIYAATRGSSPFSGLREIVVTELIHRVRTEGDVALQTLDVITWGYDGEPKSGQLAVLRTYVAGKDSVVTALGNMAGSELPFLLQTGGQLVLAYNSTLDLWIVQAAQSNKDWTDVGGSTSLLQLSANVTDQAGSFDDVGIRQQVDGRVAFRGALVLSADKDVGDQIAQVPDGLKPFTERSVMVWTNEGMAGLTVNTDGSVTVADVGLASGTIIYLDERHYRL